MIKLSKSEPKSELEEKLRKIIENSENDPSLPEDVEAYHKRYGTLSVDDLKKTFTI